MASMAAHSPAPGAVGIDFGTTNSVIARSMAGPEGCPTPP
jgi:molecular chaperone DnaK (HSP70)